MYSGVKHSYWRSEHMSFKAKYIYCVEARMYFTL